MELTCSKKSCRKSSKDIRINKLDTTNMKFKGMYRVASRYQCQKCGEVFTQLEDVMPKKNFKEWQKEQLEKAKRLLNLVNDEEKKGTDEKSS